MQCPKCRSSSVVAAPDEAPAMGLQWMKCHPCGKRWDASGILQQVRADDGLAIEEESEGQSELEAPALRSADELMQLVMNDIRVNRAEPKEDEAMGREWTPERRAKFNATMARKRGEHPAEDPASSRRGRPRKARRGTDESRPAAAAQTSAELPAPRPVAGGLAVLTVLDQAIASAQADVETLARAREILTRQAMGSGVSMGPSET